jgi:hypothetical protein
MPEGGSASHVSLLVERRIYGARPAAVVGLTRDAPGPAATPRADDERQAAASASPSFFFVFFFFFFFFFFLVFFFFSTFEKAIGGGIG